MGDLLAMFGGAEDEDEEIPEEPAPTDAMGQFFALLRRREHLLAPDRLWRFSIQQQMEEAVFDLCFRKKSKAKVDLPPEVQIIDGEVDGHKISERWDAIKELGRKVCVEEFDKIYDHHETIARRHYEERSEQRESIETQLRALAESLTPPVRAEWQTAGEALGLDATTLRRWLTPSAV